MSRSVSGVVERATFTRPRDLPGVETLAARYVTHRFLPHTHEALVLGVIEGGAESFRFRGARVVAPVGSVVVVSARDATEGGIGQTLDDDAPPAPGPGPPVELALRGASKLRAERLLEPQILW